MSEFVCLIWGMLFGWYAANNWRDRKEPSLNERLGKIIFRDVEQIMESSKFVNRSVRLVRSMKVELPDSPIFIEVSNAKAEDFYHTAALGEGE